MNIDHISVSRKQTWDLCKAKYKYQYHLKAPKEGPEPIHFAYGKMVHKVAELYVKEKGKQPIEEFASAVLQGAIPIERDGGVAPKLPAEYVPKYPRHVRAIKNLCDRIGFDGEIEWPFEYDLEPPHKKMIVGFIDRLIIRGNKYFIIDYKTSKQNSYRKTAKTIVSDLQMRCYGRVVQKEFGAKPENIKGALYYVEGQNLIHTAYTQESLDSAEQELLEAYDQIKAYDPDTVWGSPGWHCNRCEYSAMCPFFMC